MNNKNFGQKFLREYISQTPLALTFERAQECYLYPAENFVPKVLDFGCGDGIFGSITFKEKIDYGLDLNFRELLSAKEKESYNNLINASGYSLPFQNQFFNTIISNSVIEHIPDLSCVLREINRVLSPKGTFFLTIPTSKFDESPILYRILNLFRFTKLKKIFKLQYNNFWKHYHYYSVQEWHEIFEKAGFSKIIFQTYESENMAALNDALVLLSGFNYVIKKITNRFVISPKLREKFYSPFFSGLEKKMSGINKHKNEGVLLFCILKKVDK